MNPAYIPHTVLIEKNVSETEAGMVPPKRRGAQVESKRQFLSLGEIDRGFSRQNRVH